MVVPEPLTVVYKQINGSTITTDIYLPPAKDEVTHYPVLINIHGGAFILGHSKLVSFAQIQDCLSRGWIVVCPNHRLCPGVNLKDGPLADTRDFLSWVYASNGGLDSVLENFDAENGKGTRYRVDKDRVMALGTSSGGFLALGLGYDTPRPPAAILNFYGAVHFAHPCWKQPITPIKSILPAAGFEPGFLETVYHQDPVPTTSGISLEGESNPPPGRGGGRNKPDFTNPRDAFAMTQIANGTVLDAIYPAEQGDILTLDPVTRIDANFPPTFIVHGDADRMVSVEVSRKLYEVLQEKGVNCGMVEVPGEDHTFTLGMEVGSHAWNHSVKGFEWLENVISKK
ncbi:Alpha/Beta hydrolase protein [Aspergillus unguis]